MSGSKDSYFKVKVAIMGTGVIVCILWSGRWFVWIGRRQGLQSWMWRLKVF